MWKKLFFQLKFKYLFEFLSDKKMRGQICMKIKCEYEAFSKNV